MVLAINQETFDDAVKENINEFGMATEEAIEDAVKQFEAQGVDLSNIIKDLMLSAPEDSRAVSAAVAELGKLVKSKTAQTPDKYKEQLQIIKTECDKGLAYKVLAGKEGAYNVVLDVMLKLEADAEVTQDCLKALMSLMTKQPDLLDDLGVQTIISFLDKQKDPEIQKLLLKWTKECCVMHEMNRQQLFNAGILDHLKPLLVEGASSALVRDVLAMLRALVLDDDVRVEFGRAHEHARTIASDTLCSITGLLSTFKKDEPLVTDLMLTLSSLLVRTEFCKKVEDAGGVDMIKDVMITFQDREKIIRQCFKLLKALAGNDEVKCHIIQKEFAPVIASSLNRHKETAGTAVLGLGCIAALTLRAPDNSKAFFEAGIPEVIVATMKLHLNDEKVQVIMAFFKKNGSWAVRNMVSRSRYQNEKFLLLGIEEVLQSSLQKFSSCEYDIKSALRDLGCKVNLKEAWTGKGGLITSEANKH